MSSWNSRAVDDFCSAHEAQLLNYLKASEVEVGLLLNFGPKPRIKRLAFSNERKRSRPEVVVDFLLTALIVPFSAFIVRLL